jgi:NodT family efflux transporter outer membrane factor (OMF) lipoprotein
VCFPSHGTRRLSDGIFGPSRGLRCSSPRLVRPTVLVAAFLATSALTAGCAGAPRKPPPSTVPPPPRLTDVDVVSTATPPPHWWRLYREPALDEWVEAALANNRDLRVAAAHLLEARALLSGVQGRRLPQTNITASAGVGSTLQDQVEAAFDHSDTIRTGPRFGLGTDVTWEVDFFGRLRSSINAARADAEATAAMADSVRVTVAAEVTRAWLDACGYSHRLTVARHSLDLVERSRDLAERLRAAGVGLPVDVARQKALVAQISATIAPLESGRHNALVELAVLAGHVPAEIPAAADTCARIPEINTLLPVGDALTLLRRRPDVRAAERHLQSATDRIGIATADFYPRISLGADFASSSHTPGDLGERNNMVWQVGPLLSWSFPNISAARARLAQAHARESAALALFDTTVLKALQEVNQSAANYNTTLRRRAALRVAADQSAAADHILSQMRAAGAATALEALDAERADAEAQSSLAAAEADVACAQVVLFKALGGGWENAT